MPKFDSATKHLRCIYMLGNELQTEIQFSRFCFFTALADTHVSDKKINKIGTNYFKLLISRHIILKCFYFIAVHKIIIQETT